MDAIDFNHYQDYRTSYSIEDNVSNKLVHTPYFKTNIIKISKEITKDYSKIDSFVIYMCVESGFTGDGYSLPPAGAGAFKPVHQELELPFPPHKGRQPTFGADIKTCSSVARA